MSDKIARWRTTNTGGGTTRTYPTRHLGEALVVVGGKDDDERSRREEGETMVESCLCSNRHGAKPRDGGELPAVVLVGFQDQDRAADLALPAVMATMTATLGPYHCYTAHPVVATTTTMLPKTSLGSFGTRSRGVCAVR